MAAGLGYKEFLTGDVLTAADANGYLASQVVMVFASSAARAAAITSPQEGMITYLKDTNSTEYYSGSAYVSIAGTPSSLTLLSTTSLTGSTTTVSGISGSYKNLVIFVKDFYGSVATDFIMGINSDNTAANYVQSVTRSTGTTASNFADNTFAGIFFAGWAGTTSQTDNFAYITIPDYANATTKKAVNAYCAQTNNLSALAVSNTTLAYHGTVAAVTALNFKVASGTWSAGSVEIYGQN